MGFLRVLRLPPTVQVRLIGDSKLPIGVNVSVSCCLSLYVGPVIDWQPVQGVPRLSPTASWDRLQHPCEPLRINSIYNGWMDLFSDIGKGPVCRMSEKRVETQGRT